MRQRKDNRKGGKDNGRKGLPGVPSSPYIHVALRRTQGHLFPREHFCCFHCLDDYYLTRKFVCVCVCVHACMSLYDMRMYEKNSERHSCGKWGKAGK